jgi:hypothetical protein
MPQFTQSLIQIYFYICSYLLLQELKVLITCVISALQIGHFYYGVSDYRPDS